MRKDRLVGFCTEASGEIGYGHLMECLSLAEYLLQKGLFIKFYINDDTQAINFLKGKGIQNAVTEGINQLEKILLQNKPDICIFNLRSISLEPQEITHRLNIKTAIIDELGDKGILSDILINGSAIDEWHRYTYCHTTPLTLFGPKYMIMRKEFQNYHAKKKTLDLNTVLVTMGGVDRTGTTLKVVKALEILSKVRKRVVIGPGFARREELNKIANELDDSYELIYSSDNMAELLYTSDVAFTAGGNTLYETACVGTPVIVLWEDEHEGVQGTWFERKGVAINLGRGVQVDLEDIEKAAEELLSDEDRRRQMSRKGKSTVDGRGIERVGKVLCGLI